MARRGWFARRVCREIDQAGEGPSADGLGSVRRAHEPQKVSVAQLGSNRESDLDGEDCEFYSITL